MGDGELVGTRLQSRVGLVVDTIKIGDVLRTVVSKRRETDRERVVVVGQHEAFGGNHGGVTDLVA